VLDDSFKVSADEICGTVNDDSPGTSCGQAFAHQSWSAGLSRHRSTNADATRRDRGLATRFLFNLGFVVALELATDSGSGLSCAGEYATVNLYLT
jgi:hypothetical protein